MSNQQNTASLAYETLLGARLVIPLLAVLLLVPVSFFSYLLFHTLAELISIVIATSAFVVAWNTHPFSRNNFLLVLGTGLLWLGALDLFHTLVYKGMRIYPGVDSANLPTQFWIGARYLQALILLAAPLAGRYELHRGAVLLGIGVSALLVFVWIMSGNFPDAYLEGQGLTPFKIYSEYLIIAILCAALWHLYLRRATMDARILLLVATAIVATIISELSFTFYVSVYGLSNLVGHLFKIFAYWYIYVALVEYALAEPFRLMAHAATTYDAVPDPTVLIDRAGIIRQTNAAARRFTELAEPEMVGRDCHALFHPSDLTADDCPACQAIRAGASAEGIELQDECEQRWTEITLSTVTRGKRTAGMVHVSRDITDRQQAAIKLARNHADLQRFAEVTAHHLQEPARRLNSYAERLKMQLAGRLDDPEVRFSLDVIGQQARREQNLLRDVERYLAADQPRGEVKTIDVNPIVAELLAQRATAIGNANADISVGDLPSACIDAPRLADVFAVTLDNALQHGVSESPLRIAIEGEHRGSLARYGIRDNGPGIESEYRERVFRVFERLSSKSEGTGIGLAILRRITESVGGRAWIEEAPGGGCQVWFELPAGKEIQ